METPLIIFGVGAVIVVVVVFVIVAYVHERKRTEQLRQIAEELSFRFLGENDGDLLAHLGDFNLFSQGRSRKLKNLMVGTSSDTEVAIFDYSVHDRQRKELAHPQAIGDSLSVRSSPSPQF